VTPIPQRRTAMSARNHGEPEMRHARRGLRRTFAFAVLFGLLAALTAVTAWVTFPSALAQSDGRFPGGAEGIASDADAWRAIRHGVSGTVSIPDRKAAVLVQSEGDTWRKWRLGPIFWVGGTAFWTMFFVIFGFYQLRGRVRISGGRSGRRIRRFSALERFAHWLTAGSFVILAITGVNLLYGRYVVRFFQDWLGVAGDLPGGASATYALITQYGKFAHNYVGFAFMAGLLLIFVLWVRDNLWDRYDWGWIRKGGGLFFETEHPPAAKFNFGQKTVFWMVIGVGLVLSLTGLNLLMPFALTSMEQMQWIQAIHGTASQVLCMLMLAHIYIGSIGMEDSIHAMTTGLVDENWAKEHHSAWYDQVRREEAEIRAHGARITREVPAE